MNDSGTCPRRSLADLAFTADQLADGRAPPRLWHVRNMVPARAVTLFQGDGGTGKSTVAVQLAAATVLGARWLGQDVRKGKALYLSAEDDRDELHRRLDAVTLDYDASTAEMTGLKLIDVTSEDSVLASVDRSGRLQPTDRWHEFQAIAQAWEPALIIIDNLADAFAGEENSRPHARQFVSLLQSCASRLDASVVLIGHPSLVGMASGSGSSGSTAWNNSVRSRLYLTKPKPEEGAPESPDLRILKVVKANYGPGGAEMQLRWAGGVFHAEEGATVSLAGAHRDLANAKADQTFLDLLAAYEARGRTVGDRPSATYAPTLFAKDPAAIGLTRQGFERAMNRLFAAGEIEVVTVGPPSRQQRKIVRTVQEMAA